MRIHVLCLCVSLLALAACSDGAAEGAADMGDARLDTGLGDGGASDAPDAGRADLPRGDAPSDLTDARGEVGATDADAGRAADLMPDQGSVEVAQAQLLAVPESERWQLPALDGPAYVVRTEAGVPHVYAQSRDDMARVLGFTVARDRFFIMDLQRRLGLGTVSALLGDMALATDLESRTTGIAFVAERVLDGLTPADAAYFDAFAAGVNAYIDQVAAGTLPPPSEFVFAAPLLGASRPADVMQPFDRASLAAMVAVVVYQTTFETGDVDREANARALPGLFPEGPLAELRRRGAAADIWDRLEALFPFASAPGFGLYEGDELVTPGAAKRRAVAPAAARPNTRRPLPAPLAERAGQTLARLKRRLLRDELGAFGSNAWAVAGSHTRDGAALVAGDGHLSLAVPPLMYQIGLDTTVFGGGDLHQAGLLLTGLPVLAVGTNGQVAWSQVNPVFDITDWYVEELRLDAAGRPADSRFQGDWRPLVAIEEVYDIADVPALDSVGRQETWTRWTTFDGRALFDIEGRALAAGEAPGPGESVANLLGTRIVPGDQDGDGIVSAISFDYVAFDITGYVQTLERFGRARDVREYRELTRGLVGNALFTAAADAAGNVLYSSYQAVPCRGYLPRGADGAFVPGADPTQLLDGTTYGGFHVPTGPDGLVDEAPGQSDPYQCVVPFDETPQAINPTAGFVVTANNQPAPIQDDGRIDNEPHYLGGPWASPRADSIAGALQAAVAAGTADVAAMAAVQAHHRSRLGELFTPSLLDTVARAQQLVLAAPGSLPAHEQRLLDLYEPAQTLIDEAAERLAEWATLGCETPSGVETFYHAPSARDLRDAVATQIFNAWLPRAIQGTFSDEPMDVVWRFGGSLTRIWALRRFLAGRGAANPDHLASFNPDTGESAFFDVLTTPEIERSDEILLAALGDALAFLRGPASGAGKGGFGTDDMSAWLWGLRHQVRFESLLGDFLDASDPLFGQLIRQFSITTRQIPLATELPVGDPRRGLTWFPRGGDNYTVDAANPGFSGTDFTYGSGPVMRMVIALKDGRVTGQNIIPGGQSGLTDSPHFADQARLWLANEALPLRFHVEDVVAGAVGREVFVPAGR